MNISKIKATIWPLVDVLLAVLSLFAIIMFVVGGISTIENVVTQRRYVQRLDEVGRVTEGVVDFQSKENGWIIVDFTDASGQDRSNVLEMKYYSEEAWQQLKPGTKVTIRYLPYPNIGSDRIILEEEFEQVRSYVGFFENDVGTVFLASWVILIIKPQVLYLGLVDIEKLQLLPGA